MRLDLACGLHHISAVKKAFSYRWLIGAFIALFFSLQSYSLSHAASHSDAPHDHDGIACAVTVLADDQIVVLPTAPIFETVISDISEALYPDLTPAPFITPQGRAPPPRAPPNAI